MSGPSSPDAALESEAPALFAALSPLGRRARPGALRAPAPDALPARAPEAGLRAVDQAAALTAEHAAAWSVSRERLLAALGGLAPAERADALSAPPLGGFPELRRAWRERQRRVLPKGVPEGVPSSLPLVTSGLSQGLSLVADLFGGEGRVVATPEPFWGNYRQAFAVRTGARLCTAPAYLEGRFNVRALEAALAAVPAGEPAVALLNLPSNPGGYSPGPGERRELLASLLAMADRRPLVVVCDDAYAGLVFEPGIERASPFWDLAAAAHPRLVPVKIDGATKELAFFGGRVGFLTFALAAGSAAAEALENKVRMLVRSAADSPSAVSQLLVLAALRRPDTEEAVERLRALLGERYRALKTALAATDPRLLTVLPFNSGCFALLELPAMSAVAGRPALGAEAVRRRLLDHYDSGVITVSPRHLRLAHCSVAAEALPELARRLERAVGELIRGEPAGRSPSAHGRAEAPG